MKPGDESAGKPDVIWMFLASVVTAMLAFLALIGSQQRGVFGAVGVVAVVFLAAFTAGALLGFLFGIPRVLTEDRATAVRNVANEVNRNQRMLQSNTNLERISDWLATMLVGVGLSQLPNINSGLLAFREYIAATATVFDGPGGPHAGVVPAVAPSFLIAGACVGFMMMYLYTRTSLVRVLQAVEEELLTGGTGRAVRETADRLADEPGNFVAAQVAKSSSVSVDDALRLMFNLLYKPGQYGEVIRLGRELVGTSASQRAEYWFYLAAAFGQQMKDRDPADEERRKSDRADALDAARRAVALDPSFRRRLRYIADPEGSERDLELLWTDPEFKEIVGRT